MATISLKDNEDAFIPIVINDPDTQIRLDDYTIEMHIKRSVGDAASIITGTIANGHLTIVDAVKRQLEVFISRADVKDTLGVGTFVFDIQLVDKVTGYAESTPVTTLTVTRGVTHPTP